MHRIAEFNGIESRSQIGITNVRMHSLKEEFDLEKVEMHPNLGHSAAHFSTSAVYKKQVYSACQVGLLRSR